MRPVLPLAVAPLALALSLLAGAALAQSSGVPSTDDLIRQLKPTAHGPTRGIGLLAPPSHDAPAPVAETSHPSGARLVHTATNAARPAVVSSAPAGPTGDPQGTANLTVEFELNSDRLTPAARSMLDKLGQALRSPDLMHDRFEVVGHTDTLGRPDTNQTLSERRAASVARYLEANFGVDAHRLVALGKGQTEPLVPTGDNVAQPRNRRVQVINLGA